MAVFIPDIFSGYLNGMRTANEDNWKDLQNYNNIQKGQLDNAFKFATFDPAVRVAWNQGANSDYNRLLSALTADSKIRTGQTYMANGGPEATGYNSAMTARYNTGLIPINASAEAAKGQATAQYTLPMTEAQYQGTLMSNEYQQSVLNGLQNQANATGGQPQPNTTGVQPNASGNNPFFVDPSGGANSQTTAPAPAPTTSAPVTSSNYNFSIPSNTGLGDPNNIADGTLGDFWQQNQQPAPSPVATGLAYNNQFGMTGTM